MVPLLPDPFFHAAFLRHFMQYWQSGLHRLEQVLATYKNDAFMRTAVGHHCRLVVEVPAHTAFQGICNVQYWWTHHVAGRTTQLHDVFTVRTGATAVTFQVSLIQPGVRVCWYVKESRLHGLDDPAEWNGTTIDWEVQPTVKGCVVYMTHRGLEPGMECYESCVNGWAYFIKDSLYRLLTEGCRSSR